LYFTIQKASQLRPQAESEAIIARILSSLASHAADNPGAGVSSSGLIGKAQMSQSVRSFVCAVTVVTAAVAASVTASNRFLFNIILILYFLFYSSIAGEGKKLFVIIEFSESIGWLNC